MQLIDHPISRKKLARIAQQTFGNLVKAVVDVDKETMVIDASLHADEETYLLSNGSNQDDLWGINLYPELAGDDFIEFDSMINIRPNRGNSSRGVDNPQLQARIRTIISKLIE